MAMAAAAFLRSVAAKTARAPPPRLPSALAREERLSNRLWLSRFSTSTGSTPPTNIRGPQTNNKKVPSGGSEWWCRAIAPFMDATTISALFLLLGGYAFIYFRIKPAMERIEADMAALRATWARLSERIEKNSERQRAILFPNKESQIEPADVSEDEKITASGRQGKEHF